MTKAEFLALAEGQNFVSAKKLTGLRPVTINNYARRVSVVVTNARTPATELTSEQVEHYIRESILRGMSNINAATTCVALKFFITRVLRKPWHDFPFPRVHRHRKRRSRPLSRDEIVRLLQYTSGRRYRLMFALMYGSGLRVGEACRLRLRDMDFHNYKVYIRDAKGGRQRETVLPRYLAEELKTYIAERRPLVYLFPSGRATYAADTLFPVIMRSAPLSSRSVHRAFNLVRDALELPGLVTVHSLRHSFATHLVEYSLPIFSVQRLLGHQHLQTTLGYLSSLSKPIVEDFSPLDRLPDRAYLHL